MEPSPGVCSIRHRVALSHGEHLTALRLSGDDAFDALDRLSSADLFLRECQMLHTLFLDERARPFADLYVCRDDGAFVLLAEGPSEAELLAHIRATLKPGTRVDIEELGPTHVLLSLDGPWAWELMSELVGPEVVGLPYLNMVRFGSWLCFRAGKTGEYGYHLLVPRAELPAAIDRISELGRSYELGRADLPALDHCALENWFFNIRREGRAAVTPIELQLQWRASRRKEFVGAAALAAQRARATERLTALVANHPLTVGDRVMYGERPIGRVVNAGPSSMFPAWVALALIELPFAHAGIERYAVKGAGSTQVVTLSPPFVDNESLYVDPRKHSFRHHELPNFPSVS